MEHKFELDDIINVLSMFGDIHINPNVSNLEFTFSITPDYAIKYISDFILNIITSDLYDYNIILFDLCIKKFINTVENISIIVRCIYITLLKAIKLIKSNIIQKEIDDKTFNIDTFINIRTLYYNKTNLINKYMSFLTKHIIIKGNNMLKIVRDYAFYMGFLNDRYQYKNTEWYLFAILIDSIKQNNKYDFVNVYKIINTYNGFSYSLTDKKRRGVLFNPELDNQGQNNIISDNKLLVFVKNIDDNIKKSFSNNVSNQQKKELFNNVIDDMVICKKIANTDDFLRLYHKYLQKRLIENNPKLDIEAKLLELLYTKNNNTNIMMEYCINDIKSTIFLNNEFKNIDIVFDSNTYSQQLQQLYNRDISTFNILRHNTWTIDNNHARLCEPNLIKMHLDIFNKFYTSYFSNYSDRKLLYNYDISTVDIELFINGRNYNLHMNLLHATILGHIYDNKQLSALKLAEIMNVQLKDINLEINSLIYSKIVTRDAKYESDDIEVIFFINPDFTSEYNIINIIDVMNSIISYNDIKSNTLDNIIQSNIKNIITDIIIHNDDKSINHNILYNTLVQFMKEHKNTEIQNFIMSFDIFEQLLSQMISDGIISKKNDIYSIMGVNNVSACDLESDDYNIIYT